MQLELKRIQGEVGITFVYVTHDQEEAMTMSDRLAVMRRGVIEQIGGPEEVYERPATEFVAGFLGASNLLDGRVADGAGAHAAVDLADGTRLAVPREALNGHGSTVKFGMRPEKIHLEADDGRPPDGWNCVAGLLRVATYVGVSHQYTVEGPGGRVLTVYAQNLGGKGERVPDPGEAVRLRWRPEHTFVVTPEPASIEEEEEEA